ncbi:MAG: DUF481 domain-containing protein [Pseudomonadales bacterium]|nr:DUF481 domain-containing protein [Pseudomonadales bacterium]
MKKIVAVILSFSALHANAITNIESQRLAPLDQGLSGHVELTIDGKSGNSEEEDYGLSARVNHLNESDLFFVIASKEYGTSNDTKDTDNNFVHGRWVHDLGDRWATEAFVQYQDDEFTRLLSRYLAGGGARWEAINIPNLKQLTFGAGAFYVTEKQDFSTYEDEQDYLRINSYASYKHQLNDNVSVSCTAYYQPRASKLSDYNLLVNAAMSAKLSEQLKLRLAFKVTHDSEPPKNLDSNPPIDIESTDTEYAASFIYEF